MFYYYYRLYFNNDNIFIYILLNINYINTYLYNIKATVINLITKLGNVNLYLLILLLSVIFLKFRKAYKDYIFIVCFH